MVMVVIIQEVQVDRGFMRLQSVGDEVEVELNVPFIDCGEIPSKEEMKARTSLHPGETER